MENQVVSPASEVRIIMDLEGATKIPPTQTPRSRLLLGCGESILAVAQKAYRRVETMGCPVGCLAKGVSGAERVFRKVDDLVLLMESLPVRFDGAIDGLKVFVASVKNGVKGLVPKQCCGADVFREPGTSGVTRKKARCTV